MVNVLLHSLYSIAVPIPVRFNPAAYFVKEGIDVNAVITLEALQDHPDFDFTVTVLTQDGSAAGEFTICMANL